MMMSRTQMQPRCPEISSDTSYCDREEWGSRSSLSQIDDVSSSSEDVTIIRAERDALARKLAVERAKAAEAARAHDARLAELHGVIAELVRRRAQDKHATAIPEEDVSEECESATQPAGENDNDADGERSRTDQNECSSPLSPDLPTPQELQSGHLPEDTSDTSTTQEHLRPASPALLTTTPADDAPAHPSDDELCLNTARCCQASRHALCAGQAGGVSAVSVAGAGSSCERKHGSLEGSTRMLPASPAEFMPRGGERDHSSIEGSIRVLPASPGRSGSRQAKLASRVRLRRTEEPDTAYDDEAWCAGCAERLAGSVRAQAGVREMLVAREHHAEAAAVQAWRSRCARLEADCRVLRAALARALDTAHRYSTACAVQESSCVSLCVSLAAADRALETYDVLLALAETANLPDAQLHTERAQVERVARALLSRLQSEPAALGQPLLSPGPWLQHEHDGESGAPWTAACESQLRQHAARLKADTVRLRSLAPAPVLFSYHDAEDESQPSGGASCSPAADMEDAVRAQEQAMARETAAFARAVLLGVRLPRSDPDLPPTPPSPADGTPRRRHWLHHASETDL